MPRRAQLTTHHLAPWIVDDELAGLTVGDAALPFPGCGLETELGVLVHGAGGDVQPELGRLLARRRGIPARASDPDSTSSFEADRQFDTLGSTYREGDHLELNTWYRRSGIAARWNLERLLIRAGELAHEDRDHVLLHATGGDCQGSTWSSLHANVAVSDLGYQRLCSNYRACRVALDYYLPAQISLTVVDGNGGVGAGGYLLSDRLAEFDAVFGSGTMRPARAMLVDRSERFGNARIMNMLRPLSFGRASCAGLVMTQLDCLGADLMVHGALRAPALELRDPVTAAAELAPHEHRRRAAHMQRRVQQVRWTVVNGLARAFGEEFVEQLVPGARDELRFVDATLLAIERDDEDALLERCDWARKLQLFREHLDCSRSGWAAARPELIELHFHYARLDERALRHLFPAAAMPPTHRPDTLPHETSSWLLHWVCARAESDPAWREALRAIDISWHGFDRCRGGAPEPVDSAAPPAARRRESIDLQPWRFTRRATAAALDGVFDVDDLFACFGRDHVPFGNGSGRILWPIEGGPLPPTPRPRR